MAVWLDSAADTRASAAWQTDSSSCTSATGGGRKERNGEDRRISSAQDKGPAAAGTEHNSLAISYVTFLQNVIS